MVKNIELYNDDCLKIMKNFKSNEIQQIFSDPPYNLSGNGFQTCKSGKMTKCDKGEWDKIEDIHKFNRKWMKECIRVLKNDGTMWISGTLHNHPSIGMLLKEFKMWTINDIVWYKPNASPLLQTNRFAPSTELIWLASKSKKYYFDYETAKKMNNGKQMRNLWTLIATKHKTTHPAEKPEELLKRIILIGSKENDTILDPFMGSGTTGVMAKKFNRKFIGIEMDEKYFEIAKKRIEGTSTNSTINVFI